MTRMVKIKDFRSYSTNTNHLSSFSFYAFFPAIYVEGARLFDASRHGARL